MDDILIYFSIIHKGNWNKIYQDILSKKPVKKEEVSEIVKDMKDSYITLIDKDYPNCLKNTFRPPFVLYYRGDISLLRSQNKKIAVIGSRNNSDYGQKVTEKICKELVSNNVIIVSGLARGIDSIAHKTCLLNNGKTIAVLGNGLNVVYPSENKELYEKIEKNGLIISEYPFDTTPDSANFPERNRIISGISDGVAVMEANVKSGTMNTVSHALEDGKQIFCVPERINGLSGCNKLLKEGAKLIENATDILDEL